MTSYNLPDLSARLGFRPSADTGLTQYRYDEANNLRQKTVASGQSAVFAYDAINRLTQSQLENQTSTFTWGKSPEAPIQAITGPGHTAQSDYDEAGRLTTYTQTVNGQAYRSHYSYDRQGQLKTKTLPEGTRLNFQYHESNSNPGTLKAITTGAWYQPKAPIITGLNDEPEGTAHWDWQAPNGLNTTLIRENNRLAGLRTDTLHDLVYSYNLQGKISGIDNQAKIQARYRYDAQGRLDLAITPEALLGYAYDANGNRTRAVVNGRHTAYRHAENSNRLTAIQREVSSQAVPLRVSTSDQAKAAKLLGDKALTLNAQGAIEQLGALAITYNPNGQPEKIKRHGKTLATYQYNARAQRIAKTSYNSKGQATQTTHYLYEGNRLIGEAQPNGQVTRLYHYLGHHPVAISEGAIRYSVHTNHLGAPIAVTDDHQTLIWQASYLPFGQAAINEDPDKDGENFTLNLRLPGQYADTETGLYYNHHRYYDPTQGRYISSDPLGLAAGMNTYAYAANDPVNNIDPTGLLLFAFDGTGNSDTAPLDERTNVWQFREVYRGDPRELRVRPQAGHGEHWYYIAGPGTFDQRSGISGGVRDSLQGRTVGRRVIKMFEYLIDYLEWMSQNNQRRVTVNIDIVGFSRGAASARIFANLLDAYLAGDNEFIVNNDTNDVMRFRGPNIDRANQYRNANCISLNLRFLGLWDTVPHLGTAEFNDSIESHGMDGDAFLAIPAIVQHTAHAISVNENRWIFDAISVHDSPGQTSGNKVEKGFIGAHADIGGGYRNSDLSNVAFMWIVEQAKRAGLSNSVINNARITARGWDQVRRPIVNDEVFRAPFFRVFQPHRDFRYLDSGQATDVRQQNWVGSGRNLTHGSALTMINENIYRDDDTKDGLHETELRQVSGRFLYQEWLLDNYGLDITIGN